MTRTLARSGSREARRLGYPRPLRGPLAATRREFLTRAASGLAAVSFLAACGDDDRGASGDAGGPARAVEHQFGTTEVRGTPQRVVTVGWTEQDALLALGIVPVATTEWVGEAPGAIHPWALDELGDAEVPETLSNTDGIEFERIASLRPDLILALYVPFGLEQADYDRLSRIAPTIAPPADVASGGISWQDVTRTVGTAVGRRAEADRIVADVEARFAKARAEHPAFIGATALNAYPGEDGTFQVYPPPDPGGRLLTELGFVVPQPILDLAGGEAWVDLSGERLDLLDVDALVWLVDTYVRRDELMRQPLYAALDVAKQRRDIFLSYDEDAEVAAATSMQTVLSLPFLLDELVPRLARALDGDART